MTWKENISKKINVSVFQLATYIFFSVLLCITRITKFVTFVYKLYRMYYSFFGVHPNLWKFCRRLRDLQEMHENEELQHLGGRRITMMRKEDRIKEDFLQLLRNAFLFSEQTVLDGYNYITQVAFKMRKYNINNDIEINNDDVP
jgi:hypothetical protein